MRKDSLSLISLVMALLAVTTLAGRGHYLFPAIFAGLYLLSPVIPLRVNLSSRAFLILRIILLIPFIIGMVIDQSIGTMLMLERIFYLCGLYFALLTAILAYKKKEKGDAITLLALVLLMFITGGYKTNSYYPLLLAVETALIIYYCIEEEHISMTREKKRSPAYWLSILLCTLFLLGSSLALARFFLWTETKVGSLYLATLQSLSFSSAFSNNARLESIDAMKGSNRTVLRIMSSSQPSYLVGKTFQTYRNSTWEAARKSKLIVPQGEPARVAFGKLFPEGKGNLFCMAPGGEVKQALLRPMAFMAIYLTAPDTENLFAPKETLFVTVRADQLRREETGVITATMKNARGEYQLAIDRKMALLEKDDSFDFSPYLQVPDTLAESLDRLGAEVFSPSDAPWDKARKMEDFFHREFRYDTAPTAEKGSDALLPFLFEKRQGHCEFFATAMTLLLRKNGIPARYINGFLVEEYNRLGGYWVAREKDAHAWVEAYIPSRGWVTYDPTPPLAAKEKLPVVPLWLREFYDLMKLKFHSFMERLVAGDIKELFVYLGLQVKLLVLWLIASPPRALIVLAMALLIYLVKTKKLVFLNVLKKKGVLKKTPLDLPPDKKELAEVAEELEKLLARRKLTRKSCMTHYEFSRELDTLPLDDSQKKALDDFYRAYCTLRYGKEQVEPQDMEEIKEKLHQVRIKMGTGTRKLTVTPRKT